jgi:hypothetical protein
MAQSPCFLSPLADSPSLPLLVPFTYLETLLAVTGSVHLSLRLLVNWLPLSQPFPIPSPLQIPSTQVNRRLTKTTSRIRLLLSGTIGVYVAAEKNLPSFINRSAVLLFPEMLLSVKRLYQKILRERIQWVSIFLIFAKTWWYYCSLVLNYSTWRVFGVWP